MCDENNRNTFMTHSRVFSTIFEKNLNFDHCKVNLDKNLSIKNHNKCSGIFTTISLYSSFEG